MLTSDPRAENVHQQHERQGLRARLQLWRHGLPVQEAGLHVRRSRLHCPGLPR